MVSSMTVVVANPVLGRKPQDHSGSQVREFWYHENYKLYVISKGEVILTFHFNFQHTSSNIKKLILKLIQVKVIQHL